MDNIRWALIGAGDIAQKRVGPALKAQPCSRLEVIVDVSRARAEKLADQLGVTYQQVQRYENGNNRLNVENIQLIAGILSVPVSQFFATDEVLMVAEERPAYLPADENKLLNYYRKIENSGFKDLVMQVARLAVKAKA